MVDIVLMTALTTLGAFLYNSLPPSSVGSISRLRTSDQPGLRWPGQVNLLRSQGHKLQLIRERIPDKDEVAGSSQLGPLSQ